MEEWISLQEFMRRKKIGQEVAYKLLKTGKYEYEMTPGGRYKIKVGGDTVSRELYENLLKENTELKTKLSLVKQVLV